jgi:hypothetical protein
VLDSEEKEKMKVHAQVSVAKPLDGFITIPDGPKHDLSVEIVRWLRDKLGLDGQLLVQQAEVVLHLRVVCDDDTLSKSVVLRTTSAT